MEVRWKLYRCYHELGQSADALAALQAIPSRQRPPRVHLALGKLYEAGGLRRSAVACYKEVLKQCPLAVDVAENLMRLGVKAREVQGRKGLELEKMRRVRCLRRIFLIYLLRTRNCEKVIVVHSKSTYFLITCPFFPWTVSSVRDVNVRVNTFLLSLLTHTVPGKTVCE